MATTKRQLPNLNSAEIETPIQIESTLAISPLPANYDLQAFRGVPHPPAPIWSMLATGFVGICLFVVGLLCMIGARLVGLVPLVGLGWTATYVTGKFSALLHRWTFDETRIRDVEALGEGQPDEYYVGIAYSEGVWSFRGDPMWDRGFLTVEEDELIFRGYERKFILPMGRLVSAKVIRARTLLNCEIPLISLTWLDEDGQSQSILLELREWSSLSKWWAHSRSFARGLEAKKGHAKRVWITNEWKAPFRSSSLEFSHGEASRMSRFDLWMACGVVILAVGLGIVLVSWMGREFPLIWLVIPFVSGIAGWIYRKILRRLAAFRRQRTGAR